MLDSAFDDLKRMNKRQVCLFTRGAGFSALLISQFRVDAERQDCDWFYSNPMYWFWVRSSCPEANRLIGCPPWSLRQDFWIGSGQLLETCDIYIDECFAFDVVFMLVYWFILVSVSTTVVWNDCVFGIDDLERIDGLHRIRVSHCCRS